MEKILTIAIPTYNRRKYLGLALNSIFSQYDEKVEVIVSDNCSTDDTKDFVSKEYPKAIYYCNERNIGMENFKRCYDRANGKYIMLLGDDDILLEGAISHILHFLEENDNLDLIILNHVFFKDNYLEKCERSKSFFNCDNDFLTSNKKTFMKFAKSQLTFISCIIISKKAYLLVDNPQKYLENEYVKFMHTCVEIEATKRDDSRFGVISKICVAQNIPSTSGNKDMNYIMSTFCVNFYNAYCKLSPQMGYDKRQMNKIFINKSIKSIPGFILGFKAKGLDWQKAFWEKGFPIYRKYIKAWFTIIPIAFVPDRFVKALRVVVKTTRGENEG